MSAGAIAAGTPVEREPLWRRLLHTPAEGWASVLVLARDAR